MRIREEQLTNAVVCDSISFRLEAACTALSGLKGQKYEQGSLLLCVSVNVRCILVNVRGRYTERLERGYLART